MRAGIVVNVTVVWTWQARFMAEGVEGLLRDKTRRPGKPPLLDRQPTTHSRRCQTGEGKVRVDPLVLPRRRLRIRRRSQREVRRWPKRVRCPKFCRRK